MALCSVCSREATVTLTRHAGTLERPLATRAYCTECWRREGNALARLLPLPEWQVDVRDPALTGIPLDRVELFLTLERILPETDIDALAEGLRQRVAETGLPLPPELRDLVSRRSHRSV
jgi:hypothetical protein